MEMKEIYAELPVLETERLLLRKVTFDDAEDLFDYGSNEEVTRFVTWDTYQTIDDALQFIEMIIGRYQNSEVAPWGIEEKATGKLIGTIDFVWWQPQHKKAEMGYALSRKYWNKGIMTEAAKAVVAFGFEQMDLVRIQARCLVDNTGSSRVMEKAGMTYEGTLRKAFLSKGAIHDLKMYSILKEEFNGGAFSLS